MFDRGYDLVIAAADHALLRDGALRVVAAHEPAEWPRRSPSCLKKALARVGGEDGLAPLLPVPGSAAELAAVGDDRYLSDMCRRVFRAGLRHAMVDARWPAFEEAFHGFAPGRIVLMDDGELEAA